MFNLIAFSLVPDVTYQQFQTQPLRREPEASKLRWRLSFATWTRLSRQLSAIGYQPRGSARVVGATD
jgi:hypothetical protein